MRRLLRGPVDLVGIGIRAQAKNELGLNGRKASLDRREVDEGFVRRQAQAAPENRADEPVLAYSLEPRRPDTPDFPAGDIIRPERDRPILVGVSGIEGGGNGSREIQQGLRIEPGSNEAFRDRLTVHARGLQRHKRVGHLNEL